ncbi:MAG TPA: DUF3883 domain-containing protein [Desulfatiglandales bacterium]|nr:DUF3883 domain-containing protein [Desulfatiglandales bacterium]
MDSSFEHITFKKIQILLEIIFSSSDQDYEFIKQKFQLSVDKFEAVMEFLNALRLVKVKSGIIILSNDLNNIFRKNILKDDLIKSYLLEKIMISSHSFSQEVAEYLSKFKVNGDSYEYKPATKQRLKESGIRNLFIELDLVNYDKINEIYRIDEKYFYIFSDYALESSLTPEGLSCLLAKREELGMVAELVIVEYERKRLEGFSELQDQIEHTASLDVKAGYDIKSFEIEPYSEVKIIPRYIEVKAVSNFNFKFSWSRNEIERSKLLGEQYYLYLLPVISDRRFDLKNMKIISNPYEKIFNNYVDWNKQEEQYTIWQRIQN